MFPHFIVRRRFRCLVDCVPGRREISSEERIDRLISRLQLVYQDQEGRRVLVQIADIIVQRATIRDQFGGHQQQLRQVRMRFAFASFIGVDDDVTNLLQQRVDRFLWFAKRFGQ